MYVATWAHRAAGNPRIAQIEFFFLRRKQANLIAASIASVPSAQESALRLCGKQTQLRGNAAALIKKWRAGVSFRDCLSSVDDLGLSGHTATQACDTIDVSRPESSQPRVSLEQIDPAWDNAEVEGGFHGREVLSL